MTHNLTPAYYFLYVWGMAFAPNQIKLIRLGLIQMWAVGKVARSKHVFQLSKWTTLIGLRVAKKAPLQRKWNFKWTKFYWLKLYPTCFYYLLVWQLWQSSTQTEFFLGRVRMTSHFISYVIQAQLSLHCSADHFV